MLTVQMGGKSVTTTNNKQVMKINGTDIGIERIGDSIYVNGIPINLIVADKIGKNWKKIITAIIIAPGAAIGAYYLLVPNFDVIAEFVTTYLTTFGELYKSYVN